MSDEIEVPRFPQYVPEVVEKEDKDDDDEVIGASSSGGKRRSAAVQQPHIRCLLAAAHCSAVLCRLSQVAVHADRAGAAA